MFYIQEFDHQALDGLMDHRVALSTGSAACSATSSKEALSFLRAAFDENRWLICTIGDAVEVFRKDYTDRLAGVHRLMRIMPLKAFEKSYTDEIPAELSRILEVKLKNSIFVDIKEFYDDEYLIPRAVNRFRASDIYLRGLPSTNLLHVIESGSRRISILGEDSPPPAIAILLNREWEKSLVGPPNVQEIVPAWYRDPWNLETLPSEAGCE